MNENLQSLAIWHERLKACARENDMAWIVSDNPDGHRAAYEAGLAPEQELKELADMAEWRGCGCGGGG
jgi:hypothetical protein